MLTNIREGPSTPTPTTTTTRMQVLKVVGASWFQIRVSSFILAAAALLAIGSLFLIGMKRPEFDGNFCATVFWSQSVGFRVEFWGQQNDMAVVPRGVARTCYRDSTSDNGWAQLEIETQGDYPDRIQAFAAGILEGALTWNSIYNQWSNTVNDYCEADESSRLFCNWMREMISENFENIKEQMELKNKRDHYWYQIRLFYYQLQGLEFGWRKGVKRSRADIEIPPNDFLMLNAAADMRDFRIFYQNFINRTKIDEAEYEPPLAKSFMAFKLCQESDHYKLLMGHSTAKSYSSMLRVFKRYKFNYHYTNDKLSNIVPGSDITFTGYPGILASSDDFYMIRNELTVAGVTMENKNVKLWNNVDQEETVLVSARVMAANRLSSNARAWARVMSRNPGAGSKQWIVANIGRLRRLKVDSAAHVVVNATASAEREPTRISKINKNETVESYVGNSFDFADVVWRNFLKRGLVWVVDQLPGRLHAEDVTHEIIAFGGAWMGNGIPYFKETYQFSHFSNNFSQSSHHDMAVNVTDLDSMEKLMEMNAYRGDLLESNPEAFGTIDMKLYSETSTLQNQFIATSGPVTSKMGTPLPKTDGGEKKPGVLKDPRGISFIRKRFSWLNSQFAGNSHSGHPDSWNFDKISPQWAWND